MKIAITGGSGFIGTNLIDLLISNGNNDIINIDKANPYKLVHQNLWAEGNIMDLNGIREILTKFNPEVLIHLAARTDTLSSNIDDYVENTIGTQNVINAIKSVASLKRIIITSTQYVYKSFEKPFPDKDNEYKPHTTYGESKVRTEELIRHADLNCSWTIVRPANIWGPWHMRYPIELWRIIDKGLYIHPGQKEVIRTYGYVKNITYQLSSIMEASLEAVDKKTFYLGDAPIDSYVWLNEVSLQLTKKKVRRFPIIFFKSLSLIGDALKKFKLPFPLYKERYRNMIEDYAAPTAVTVKKFGVLEPDLKKNVEETINWIRGEGKDFFSYWKNK